MSDLFSPLSLNTQSSLDASVAASAILVLAAFGVLLAVRLSGRSVAELRGGG